MLGLFGALNLGARSLATQRQGVEVAGHNLANVNNPAYARQRVNIATSASVPSYLGYQGTGADPVAIVRLRSDILDQQITNEVTVRGSLDAHQEALQYAQAGLGQQLDSSAAAGEAAGVKASHSLSDGLAGLFNSFQGLSTNPSSLVERQTVLNKAATLATQFNQVDDRLSKVNASLNQAVQDDTTQANALLSEVATLNQQIARAEVMVAGSANDLRDIRQSKVEELSKLVAVDVASGNNGVLNISIAGTLMVSDHEVVEKLEAFDPGTGQLGVRALGTGTPLPLTGGRIHGTIEARDGAITALRTDLNQLAGLLIQEVNALHATGYGLGGTTGAPFFTGTNAADIGVNNALINDPTLLQAASTSGASGDNGVALALAQLGHKAHPSLGAYTFSQNYGHITTSFGQAVSAVENQLSDQEVVEKMLLQRRDSISGVSLDEEMTDLTRYQRAFQASARLITTIDELLSTVVNMKQ